MYDPLGFLAPFILTTRRILQELCKSNCGWDEEIPDVFSQQWKKRLADLNQLTGFYVNRCIKPSGFGKVISAQLQHFCDASVVTYLLQRNPTDDPHVTCIMERARVALLNYPPQLELSAVGLAVCVDTMLKSEFQIQLQKSVFWTDSKSVLSYIAKETRLHTFMANRVSVIRGLSKTTGWRYVSSKVIPADDASRGTTANLS